MTILQEYLNKLDAIQSSHIDKYEIDKNFQRIRDELNKLGDLENSKLAQLEMEIYSFTKRIEEGKLNLTFQFSGNRKDNDGNEIPFEWPDSKLYNKEDYDYVLHRFNKTQNNYSKVEYGFILLLGYDSPYKSNKIAKEILNSLFVMTRKYFEIIKQSNKDDKHYGLYFINNINYIFYLSRQRRSQDPEIYGVFESIKEYVFNTLCNWNLKYEWTLRAISDLTRLIIENFNEFRNYNLKLALEIIWNASLDISKKYEHGGIELADIGDKLELKINGSRNERWLKLIGENYERLA